MTATRQIDKNTGVSLGLLIGIAGLFLGILWRIEAQGTALREGQAENARVVERHAQILENVAGDISEINEALTHENSRLDSLLIDFYESRGQVSLLEQRVKDLEGGG